MPKKVDTKKTNIKKDNKIKEKKKHIKSKTTSKPKDIIKSELTRYDDKLLPTFRKIALPSVKYSKLEKLAKKCHKMDGIDLNLILIGKPGSCKSLLLDCFLYKMFKIRQCDITGTTDNKYIKNVNNFYKINIPVKKDNNELRDYILELCNSRGMFGIKYIIIKNFDLYPDVIKNIINYLSEKKYRNVRFIITINSINKIPYKLKSLSHLFIVNSMTDDEFITYYKKLGETYNTKLVHYRIAMKIYKSNNRNLKQTINIISSIINGKKKNPDYKPSYNILKTLSISILNKLDYSTVNGIDAFRKILYEVIMLGFNNSDLIKETVKIIIGEDDISSESKSAIIKAAADANLELTRCNTKEFLSIEKFYFTIYNNMTIKKK